MKRLSLTHFLGGGLVIYSLMFLLWSVFSTYGFVEGSLPRLIGLVVLVLIITILAHHTGATSVLKMLPYSIAWLLIAILLDVLISVPFTGWALFSDWNIWIGYALVFGVPLIVGLEAHLAHRD